MGKAIGELAHGGAVPVTLGERTYLLSSPTLRDMDTVRNWILSRLPSPLAAVAADLKNIDPKYHDAVLKAAAAVQPGGAALTAEAASKVLMTPDGCRFVFWLVARKNHPDLKTDDLKDLITEDNAAAVYRDVDDATGMNRLGNEEPPAG